MKRKALMLVVAAILLLGIASAAMAKDYSICPPPSPRNPCFYGFETDIQIGTAWPSYVGVDLGFLIQGDFSLGFGGSYMVVETQDLIGGYAKIGIAALDIIKGRVLLSPDRAEWYGSFKFKIPLALLFACDPFSVGFQYVESYLRHDCGSTYLQSFSTFLGIDMFVNKGQAEIWLEMQSPHNREIVRSCSRRYVIDRETLQFEFGFAFCF
ncbi:hypothetical protein KJ616_03075 [Patescibacteria group bacterium]|nr:hypothetical protein [Patescibacteria group bacterium]